MMLFTEITLTNLLSFGSETVTVPMRNLNVLIGANGSGKSNFIEAIVALRASAKDIQKVLRTSGGVSQWVWKGSPQSTASISAVLTNPSGKNIRHFLAFAAEQQIFRLQSERIENENAGQGQVNASTYYRYQNGLASLKANGQHHKIGSEEMDYNNSILAQRRDPEQYPELTFLATQYEKIWVYREWVFGRNAILRDPQRADGRSDRLEEDFSNLGMFLNHLRGVPAAKKAVLSALTDIYEEVNDFDVRVEGGTIQVVLDEGDYTIPAVRLSDGTLRYLCLLAILCDPNPPPLICLEEPELGLHPDMLPKIAELLIEASERTQLIVTTHSEILIDALTAYPDTILVCEKHNGKTQIERLAPADLTEWLERYRLGALWMKGVLGGTRW